MKTTAILSAVIASLSPLAFADQAAPVGTGVPVVDYHYGLHLDIAQVLQRTDNSAKTGVVETVMTYRDSQGEVHKLRYLELGGQSNQNG